MSAAWYRRLWLSLMDLRETGNAEDVRAVLGDQVLWHGKDDPAPSSASAGFLTGDEVYARGGGGNQGSHLRAHIALREALLFSPRCAAESERWHGRHEASAHRELSCF